MLVGGEIVVGRGARFTEKVETRLLDVCSYGQGDDACRTGSFLRKGVLVGGRSVFELRFRGRSGGQRGHDGEHEEQREEDGLTHGGHPRYSQDGSHRI